MELSTVHRLSGKISFSRDGRLIGPLECAYSYTLSPNWMSQRFNKHSYHCRLFMLQLPITPRLALLSTDLEF